MAAYRRGPLSRYVDRRGPWLVLPLSVRHAAFIVAVVLAGDRLGGGSSGR